MLCLVVLIAGCASGHALDRRHALPHGTGTGWWYASFHPSWEPDGVPNWYLDALLADRVVAPLLAEFRGKLPLWRFHRRAAPDVLGHRFAFIFYATPATAQGVAARLRADPLLSELERDGLLDRWSVDATRVSQKPGIGDTSDPHWSAEMQAEWPYFIMGVSRTWLGLVQAQADRHVPPGERSVLQLVP
ncbi:MAG: hypothetical protein VX663_03690, partial [Pseudomonadota bacterium]|nr:hypothetical protein [Pseudomonadota bacterium]